MGWRLMDKMLKKGLLAILVIIFCITFASENPILWESTKEKITEITVDEIEVTVVDEETLRIENLIKDGELLYTWHIYKELEGSAKSSTGMLAKSDFDVVEFYYDDLESVSFEAVVIYDGMEYESNTFYVASDGSITQSDEDTSSVSETEEISRDISDIVSLAYVAFLLGMVLVYYVVPRKAQWIVLLVASILFYVLSGIQYILFILGAALVAFLVGKEMTRKRSYIELLMKDAENSKEKKQLKAQLQKFNKQLLTIAFIVVLGIMVVIKYSNFMLSNVNSVLGLELPLLELVMPIGLSFYSFMLIAYLLDVARGKYQAEEEFARFFLFVSFFPHVSQGPISRYNEIAPQLREGKSFQYHNFCLAAQRILWGFFVKLVLADRIATLVNGVYDSYETQSWFMLIVASIAYSIQVYADFYSSMEIAIGSAQMFGITLQENFLRPYFSTNMPEFWRRWHVSLGTWFKDYVFYPISISKGLMKFTVKVRKKYGPNVARVIAAAPPIMGV